MATRSRIMSAMPSSWHDHDYVLLLSLDDHSNITARQPCFSNPSSFHSLYWQDAPYLLIALSSWQFSCAHAFKEHRQFLENNNLVVFTFSMKILLTLLWKLRTFGCPLCTGLENFNSSHSQIRRKSCIKFCVLYCDHVQSCFQ